VKAVIGWFAGNHVAANLLMLLLVVGGLAAVPSILLKTFPDIDVDMITVSVEYLGAAPEEVEEGVCVRIEEAIEGISGIDEIRSTAMEGVCVVTVELLTGTDVGQAMDDAKTRVDAIDTLPEETERPIVSEVVMRRSVIDLALSGPAGERTLKEVGQRLRDQLAALPEITQVTLSGTRPYEISIEVSEESLRRFGLSFDQVAQAVRRSSLDLPGGSVKTTGGEILLRTKGQAYRGPEFEELVVLTRADGSRVRLADVAVVLDGFEDSDQAAFFDGERAVLLRVMRVGDQDGVEIAGAVKRFVEEARGRLPEGLQLTVWQDSTQMLRSRLELMLKNGRSGYVLVLFVLALFLRPRLAFWVSLGVPISILGGLLLFPALSISINVVTSFAFILVLGILVDDAVVVGENVHTHQERGGSRIDGAVRGTQEVAVPVIFGVLTTVVAFVPMLLVPGPMGQIQGRIATVVILCLLFSLVESQLILPAHLAGGKERGPATSGPLAVWTRLQGRFAAGFERLGRQGYRDALERALAWRYLTLACGIALLLWTVGAMTSGRLRFSFFPPLQSDYVAAGLSMPQGTPVEDTQRALRQIEASIEPLRAELDLEFAGPDRSLVKHMLTSVGEQPFHEQQAENPQTLGRVSPGGSHLGEVVLELIRSEERSISTREIAQRWRELTGPVPDATLLQFSSSLFSAGDEIFIQLRGPDIDDLRAAADRLREELAAVPGVLDLADSFRAGKQEVKLSILPSGESLGLSLQDLARQVRQAFYGEEAQRIQRGRDDVRVMVRYPESGRRSLGDLEDMRIRTPEGAEVPFSTLAAAELGRGFATIRRADRQRVVDVTSDVDRRVTTANQVLAHLEADALPRILRDYPAMSYSFEGAQREQRRSLSGLLRWFVVALFAIYALLAVPLRSYAQPLLIMGVIPFGLVGAIGGHLLMGRGLSMMSIMGIIALSGVVVNASLILVHTVNSRRAWGVELCQAVREAGVARFRPIVLTSVTTFAGLTPLLLERSTQAQFLVPMAISLAFGVLFASAITLFLVPSGYLVLEDLRGLPERWRSWRQERASRADASVSGERRPGFPAET
jgi:multidrug efflux pump subunit AcrB